MKISAIILAAGGSKRMKDINKLLVLIKNKPLISLVCETFLDVEIHKLILVIGYQYQNIVELISSSLINGYENSESRENLMEFKNYLKKLNLEQLRTMSKEFIL